MATDREIFQELGQMLADVAPAGWTSCRFQGWIFDDWGKVRLFAVSANGREERFDGGQRTHDRMYVLLSDLRRTMIQAGQPVWNRVDFRLSPEGAFKTEFDFDPDGEQSAFGS